MTSRTLVLLSPGRSVSGSFFVSEIGSAQPVIYDGRTPHRHFYEIVAEDQIVGMTRKAYKSCELLASFLFAYGEDFDKPQAVALICV